jgi:PAS domain S-box-containing protein
MRPFYPKKNKMDKHPDSDSTEGIQPIDAGEESVYEIIFREMEDAIFFVDVQQTDEDYIFRFLRNNASHRDLTGLAEDELRGKTPQELLGDEQGASVEANYRRCVEQRETIQYEETLEFPAGTSHWQTKLTPISDDGHITQIVGVARDITEQKEQQQKLQRLDRRFETVLKTMSAAVFLKNTDGEYLLMNQACRELFNVDYQDIVGLTDEDFFPSEVAQQAQKDDWQVIENGEMIELEEEVPTAMGNTVRLTRKSPVYDDDGAIIGLCGVSTDITEQKEYQRTLEEQRDNLEILNQIIRHDIRNNLQLVLAYGNMLEDVVENDGEEFREQIMDAGREAVEITQTAGEVTDVLLGSGTDQTPVNLKPVLIKQIDYVRENHEHAVVSVEGTLPDVAVLADEMLDSVFRNLLNNAVVHNDKQIPQVIVSATANDDGVQVRIADNGSGIPDAQKGQIFEEGEKDFDSEGTGIGLYLVQTLVERYGGVVWIEDNEPEGSVFVVGLRCEQ